MRKVAVSQLTTLRWDLEQDIQAAADRGLGGIGIWRPKLEDHGLAATVDQLAAAGLTVSSLSWIGGFTGSDGRGFSDAIEDAIDAVQQAYQIGAETLVVLLGGRNNHIRRHLYRTACQALVEINAVAEARGVTLAIEPFHLGCGTEWSFINDIDGTLELIEAVGSDNLGLVLDTYHLGLDEDILLWLPEVISRLQLVQLGDGRQCPLGEMNRCLLGQGRVPIPEVLETLASGGYDGWLEIEVLGQDVGTSNYDAVLDHSVAYLQRYRDLVQAG